MLTENTGRHLLDSGGTYGRHWERNQGKTIGKFMREPDEFYSWDGKYLYRTVSVFHYLSGLGLDDVCRQFNRKNKREGNWDADDVYGVGEKTWAWLKENHEVDVDRTWNTYNGDSDLSQVLQGANLKIDGDDYVLIQVHGGCDVRGGYTDAMLFKCDYDGMINEQLWDYKEQSIIIEDIREGYIDDIRDYSDYSVKVSVEDVLKVLDDE
jgi:hypothetical protein